MKALWYAALLCGVVSVVPADAATYNPADCADATIRAYTTTGATPALDGDTINLPACDVTYTSGMRFYAIKLIGAGSSSTFIRRSTAITTTDFIVVEADPDYVTEVASFTCDSNEDTAPTGASCLTIDSGTVQGTNNWKVHDMAFTEISRRGLRLYATGVISSGVAYSNTFTCAVSSSSCQAVWGENCTSNATHESNAAMDSAPDWGGPLANYLEDNTFTTSTEQDGSADNYSCGRLVQRFNTLNGFNFGAHGTDSNRRGTTQLEIYGNTVLTSALDDNNLSGRILHIRNGNVLMFDNTIPSTAPGAIEILMYRTSPTFTNAAKWVYGSATVTLGGPNVRDGRKGVSPGDGTYPSAPAGYPALDQVGWEFNNAAGNGGTFERAPTYTWNNLRSGANVAMTVDSTMESGWFTANFDYYNYTASFDGTTGMGRGAIASRPATCTLGVAYWATDEGEWNSSSAGNDGKMYICTATNTWSARYGLTGSTTGLPYTYPHPLRGGVADSTNPVTTMTTSCPVSTASTPATIAGTCTDNILCTGVTWSNSAGGSGTATGTASWSFNTALSSGAQTITVTSADAAGNNTGTAVATCSVTYTPAAGSTGQPRSIIGRRLPPGDDQ